MQPVHATADAPWLAARLGAGSERHALAYAWRSALLAGLPLAFGSDFPVANPDPRAGLADAEERTPPGGPPLTPAQRLSREEALHAFTAGAALASFAEGRRGAVREGMDADLSVFTGDLLGASTASLRALPVAHTNRRWPRGVERGVLASRWVNERGLPVRARRRRSHRACGFRRRPGA